MRGTKETLHAVIGNPAAPAGVLLRLLAEEASSVWSFLAWRALPDEVVDAIVAHPAWQLRQAFAENINIEAEQRARVVDDPERRVRLALAVGPDWFRVHEPPLPVWAQRKLLLDPDERVRVEAANCHLTEGGLVAELADDPSPAMRQAACGRWGRLSPEVRERLLADPHPRVRLAAAMQACGTEPEYTDVLLKSDIAAYQRSRIIRQAALSMETAQQLAMGIEADRAALAANASTPIELVRLLAADESHAVRLLAACHPDLTEAERAEIDYEVNPQDRLQPLDWVLHAVDPEVLRACARSTHTLLRRSITYNKHLPYDVVETLAHDDDYIVRLLLCENQSTVPSEVVLQTYLDCPFVTKSDLMRHPNFPRAGNASRFAAHSDPDLRWLATLDPGITAEMLRTLTRDADGHVRRSAVAHPALPVETLLECLKCDDTRLAALRNPNLPPELLQQALDEAGIPRVSGPNGGIASHAGTQ
jgi:hypothetical protein